MIDIKSANEESVQFKILTSEESKSENRKSVDNTYANTSRSIISEASDPIFRKEVSYSISTYIIINVFIQACKKFNFAITEQTPSSCTVYHTQRCSFKSILSCCLGKSSKLKLSCAKLIISNNSVTQLRTIYVKRVSGNINLINCLIKTYTKKLESEIEKHKKLRYLKINEEEEEEEAITCKNESYSYYEFYKILSCDAYSLGKSVSDFCNSFTSQYRNYAESSQLLPQPLHSIQSIVESTVEALFSHYNYGKKNTEKVMVYCRPAVEKYIFTKLYSHLIQIYKAKYEVSDNLIEIKRKATQGLSPEQIMKFLNVDERYWMNDENEPYQEAIEILGKINEFCTPIEKLNCLMSYEVALKTCVLQYWKGQVELDSQNAILVSKYAILKAKFLSPYAEISLINDYIDEKYEEEKIILLNFEKTLYFLIN